MMEDMANICDQVEQCLSNHGFSFPLRAATTLLDVPLRAAASLSDRPVIAVLPFLNMTGEPAQDYFSDGISEDLITALSRVRWFLVAARNASFAYKGKSVQLKQIADDTGGQAYSAQDAAQLRKVFTDLPKDVTVQKRNHEVTATFVAFGAVLAVPRISSPSTATTVRAGGADIHISRARSSVTSRSHV